MAVRFMRELFELKYPKHVPFLLQYMSFLCSMNERCLNFDYLKKTQGSVLFDNAQIH